MHLIFEVKPKSWPKLHLIVPDRKQVYDICYHPKISNHSKRDWFEATPTPR